MITIRGPGPRTDERIIPEAAAEHASAAAQLACAPGAIIRVDAPAGRV